MEENVIDVEEIPEKGITVTTAVVGGVIETSIQQSVPDQGPSKPAEIATIQTPVSEGHPLIQHDLAVRDVYVGKYDDLSEEASPPASH